MLKTQGIITLEYGTITTGEDEAQIWEASLMASWPKRQACKKVKAVRGSSPTSALRKLLCTLGWKEDSLPYPGAERRAEAPSLRAKVRAIMEDPDAH